MGKQFNFGGISGTMEEGIERDYELVYDDGDEQVYQLKEYIEHNEEDLPFHFYYVIRVIDLYEHYEQVGKDYEGQSSVEIELVVHPRHIKPKLLNSIKETMGLDSPEEITTHDLLIYGGASVFLANEIVPNDNVQDKLIEAMNAIDSIDLARGFYLDKAWNKIGTTGWDVIHYALGKKENLFF